MEKVPVMFHWGPAIDAYVVLNGNDAGETVSYLVHVHLEDI